MALPEPAEITRQELAAPHFEVGQFLVEHSQFRSLRDLREAVKKWEDRLQGELEDTVNDNFLTFTANQATLTNCREYLSSIKLQVLKFEADVAKVLKTLEERNRFATKQIDHQRALHAKEKRLRELIGFVDGVEQLRTQLQNACSPEKVVSLAKVYTGLSQFASSHGEYAIVTLNAPVLSSQKQLLLELLTENIKAHKGDNFIMDLLMARCYVSDLH